MSGDVNKSGSKMSHRAAEHYTRIVKALEGENGATGLTALVYALIACARSVGVEKQAIKEVIDECWEKEW